MDVKVQIANGAHSPTNPSIMLKEQKVVSSPAGEKVSTRTRLPPLPLEATSDCHPQNTILKQAKDEVRSIMKLLLVEAQSSESRIQQEMDSLWRSMLSMIEECSQMYQKQLADAHLNLEESKRKVARLTMQEAALVQQNARASVQLVAEESKRKELEFSLESTNKRLQSCEQEAQQLKKCAEENEQKHRDELTKLQSQMEGKSNSLRDYQMTITKLTDKLNKLLKDFSLEKSSAEKLQKSSTDQLSLQAAENRKQALEISKLKAQLTSSNHSLTAAREETRKCELQLKTQQQEHEGKILRNQKKFTGIIQELEAKIQSLEKELDLLKRTHRVETDALKKALMEMEKNASAMVDSDEYLEQRIRFLKHQNKQEKMKLMKDQKKT